MKGYIYEVVSKVDNVVIDMVKTRREAREIKQYMESGSNPEPVKIVQYVPKQIVR